MNSPKLTGSQVVTRSLSSASNKGTKTQTSSPIPLSVVDFQKTMAEFQKTQEQTLEQCKLLSQLQSTKFDELNKSINLLTTQVADLINENGINRNNIEDLNKRIQTLEVASNSHSTPMVDIIPTLLQEMSERERLSRNIIIRGIPESSSDNVTERISSDSLKISETIQPYFPDLPTNLKSIRLGKPSNLGPRPLKVFLSSKEVALKIITDYNNGVKDLPIASTDHRISVVRDRTLREREFTRSVYADLENRRKNGETNIMVKYRDGLPCIVLISPPSQASRTHSSANQSKN